MSPHREETCVSCGTEDRIEMQLHAHKLGRPSRASSLCYINFEIPHTYIHTHYYVHIQNTRLRDKEKSINIYIYNILYYTCSRNLSRLHYLDYDVTLCKITLRTTHIYRATIVFNYNVTPDVCVGSGALFPPRRQALSNEIPSKIK